MERLNDVCYGQCAYNNIGAAHFQGLFLKSLTHDGSHAIIFSLPSSKLYNSRVEKTGWQNRPRIILCFFLGGGDLYLVKLWSVITIIIALDFT